MIIEWKPGSTISVNTDNGAVLISANKEGLLSLADHLAALAEANGAALEEIRRKTGIE